MKERVEEWLIESADGAANYYRCTLEAQEIIKKLYAENQALSIENTRYKKKKDDEQKVRECLWRDHSELQEICTKLTEENQALKADKKELVDIICHVREVAGKDMDYGSNSEAVRKCYCISVNGLLTEAALQSEGE